MKMEVRSGKHSLTRLILGIVIIIASLLVHFHHKNWYLVTLFLGGTQIISATIGFCLTEKILHNVFKMPVKGKD